MPAPPELALTADTTEERAAQLQSALKDLSVPDFVRLCAKAQATSWTRRYSTISARRISPAHCCKCSPPRQNRRKSRKNRPQQKVPPIPTRASTRSRSSATAWSSTSSSLRTSSDILKRGDKAAFYKLSQVTTQLDLDPREFLYWLAHREDYGTDDERACAAIMDACFARLYEEKQGELLGALLSGDQKTFELFRTEAPELRHLPAATYEWYSKNYLDRDYPLRFILMCNGVEFPDKPEEDK